MEKKAKVKKIFSIVKNVIFYVFLALCVFAVVVSVVSKKDSTGAVNVLGHQILFVQSDSMGKSEFTDVSDYDIGSIPVRSMILIETVPEDPEAAAAWYANIQEGDVLTIRYTYTTQETITHRVVKPIEEKPTGGYIITLKGDNKTDENADTIEQVIDTSQADTSFNYIVGKVVWHSYPLGLLIYAVKQPVGIVGLVIIPCLIIIIFEIIRIFNVFGAEKKKKYAEEKAQTDSELEELRRRLDELQRQAEANTNTHTDTNTNTNTNTDTNTDAPADTPTTDASNAVAEEAVEKAEEEVQTPVETATEVETNSVEASVPEESKDDQT